MRTTHGHTTGGPPKIYRIWSSLVNNHRNTIHRPWLDFETFYTWADANEYKEGETRLYRTDKTVAHSPTNSFWKTPLRMKGTRLHKAWDSMRYRCTSDSFVGWDNYGGRGITYDKSWDSFDVFYKWAMNNGYGDDLTLEREDTNGNYTPDNCKWVTAQQQAVNRRTSIIWTVEGTEYESAEAAGQALGVSEGTIRNRCQGWSRGNKTYPPKPGYSYRSKY